MTKEFRMPTCGGILLCAAAALLVVLPGVYGPVGIPVDHSRQAESTHIRNAALQASDTVAVPFARQGAVLARIDSFWEADAGLEAHKVIRRHIEGARIDADSLFLLNPISALRPA